MERPGPIVWFERIIFATLAMGIMQSSLGWRAATSLAPWPFVLGVQAFVLLSMAGLTLLVSRRRSNIAKWILILFFAAGIPLFARQLAAGHVLGLMPLSMLQVFGQIVAFSLLFTFEARQWFRRSAGTPSDALSKGPQSIVQ